MRHLTSRCNEFRKVVYFSQILLAPNGVISRGGMNNEMTNTMTSHIYLSKEKVQVRGEFIEKNFTRISPEFIPSRCQMTLMKIKLATQSACPIQSNIV